MSAKTVPYSTPANPNKALWEKGDFTRIAALMRRSGDELAHSLDISPQMRVLDLGCGDGTTALPLALLGADVIGVDIAKNLVDAGNRRAAENRRLRLQFVEGDARDLHHFAKDTFDLTVSVFGAMFAPDPFAVAREMVRVTRPGGRIVMGNWIPNDPTSFVSQLLRISAAFSPPPPPDFVSPMMWGVESHVLERFGRAGIDANAITFAEQTYVFSAPGKSPEQIVNEFRRHYGPTMNAYDAAALDGRSEDLHAQLVALATQQNIDANGGTTIPATYLRVTVTF
jgi:ubiquinone/menaquinone biosynthesis C-methylase UbiE